MRPVLLVLAGAAYVLLDGPGVTQARSALGRVLNPSTSGASNGAAPTSPTVGDANPGGALYHPAIPPGAGITYA